MPDPKRIGIIDYAQTVLLGKYEASSDAILYEHDPVYRKEVKEQSREQDTSLGGSIRRLRLQKGLKQSDFPGVRSKAIGRIERGEVTEPRADTLTHIASRLGVTVEELDSYQPCSFIPCACRLDGQACLLQTASPMEERPLDIDLLMTRVDEAVRPYPKAALFELADEGFNAPFEQLVACIISVRTRDETTLPCARRLFEKARTPAEVAMLAVDEIDAAIHDSTFHEAKAPQIHAIAREIVDAYGGELPCDEDVLLSFRGVGPKCAHLVLGIACGKPEISVDVHVHRVTNRWGYVEEKTPEQTMRALQVKLPERYRVDINRLLVPFGKHICTGVRPKCSTCPVLEMCRQVGVTEHR